MTAAACFVDAGALLAHVSGTPVDARGLVADALADGDVLLVTDLVVAELIEVLERDFAVDRHFVTTVVRSLLTSRHVVSVDTDVLLHALALYELDGLRFRDAHLVAVAESTGVRVLSGSRAVQR